MEQTYLYESNENKREFTVTKRSDGTVTVSPSERATLGNQAKVRMDSDGDFAIIWDNKTVDVDSFADALETACKLISEKLDKVAKSQSEMDRFFEKGS